MKPVLIKIGKFVGVWFPTVMLISAFGTQGVAKFSATSGWARAFEHWGYPVWFRYSIGGLEVLAALLLILPLTASLGALLVIGIMLGAYATHIIGDHSWDPRHEMVPFVFACLVFYLRRDGFARLIRKRE